MPISLIWRMLRRDLRAGELTALGVALVLAVAALTGVGFLSDRVERGLARESHQLLGGDLLLTADHPWDSAYRMEAARLGLALAESAGFPSMVSSQTQSQLADLKAVTDNYPLRGTLRTAPGLNQPDALQRGTPAPGTVWLDERLMASLEATVGSRVKLGAREMSVAAVLTFEPDRGFNVFALAPRLMFNQADLAATGLVLPGSRISYRLHLAGDDKAIAGYQRWAQARLGRGERLESLDNARPELRNVLERAQRFLRLAALMAVVLAAVAMGLAARRYLRRHLDACAILRCLGASGLKVLAIHGGEFILFGLLATLLGCLLGFAVQAGLHQLLAGILGDTLPPPGPLPWLQGLLVGMTLVAGFALPPLLQLRRVSTLRVLRREWSFTEPLSLGAWLVGALMLAMLMRWIAGEWQLWFIILGGFAAAVLLFAGIARAFLVLAGKIRRGGGPGWRYGIANLRRRAGASVIQAVALALGLTALLLLTSARGDLLAAWTASVPADAANRFVISIQPDQLAAVRAEYVAAGLPEPKLEPMVRGRLVAVNDKVIGPESYADERAKRLVDREFNLSWNAALPKGNAVVEGAWHGTAKTSQFSVEQGLAETLGLHLGDELAYDIAGVRLTGHITSLRKLAWDSMRVNFFVITPPGVLDNYPASYITAFHLPRDKADFVGRLVARFPNLTVIDVESVVRQLQNTVEQVVKAVQAVFGFALLAGLVVLYAALQGTADERAQEVAILRALGARQRQLRLMLLAEFAALGAGAGLLAGIGASLIAWALATLVFHLPYVPTPWLMLEGLVAGLAVAVPAGFWGLRYTLSASPLQALREAG